LRDGRHSDRESQRGTGRAGEGGGSVRVKRWETLRQGEPEREAAVNLGLGRERRQRERLRVERNEGLFLLA
jgi:hypothetical protein